MSKYCAECDELREFFYYTKCESCQDALNNYDEYCDTEEV